MSSVIVETDCDPLPELPMREHEPAAAGPQEGSTVRRRRGARDVRALEELSADPGSERFDVDDDLGQLRHGITPEACQTSEP